MSDISVRDDGTSRYLATSGELQLGFAEYTRDGEVTTFTHTVVDPAQEGKGVGSTLVRAALDAERAAGRTIVPRCPFVKAYIAKHPEYEDLVA